MKKLIIASCVAISAFVFTAPVAFSAESNPSIVHRQGTYKVVAGHMDSLKSILFLGGAGDAAYHAKAIKAAWENMGNAFPAGSDKGDTRAKASIWEDMEGFKAKGKAAYGATLELVSATEGTDKKAMAEAFAKLGGSCKACHKEYRSK